MDIYYVVDTDLEKPEFWLTATAQGDV